jgi:hypothetical protein
MVQDIIWKADCHSARQKISRFLTEPEGSSTYSQKPATGPYPEPATTFVDMFMINVYIKFRTLRSSGLNKDLKQPVA